VERLHDPAGSVRLEGKELAVPVARVVEHPTPGVEELPEVGNLGHLRPEPDLAAGLAELLPDHFKLLLFTPKRARRTLACVVFFIAHTDPVYSFEIALTCWLSRCFHRQRGRTSPSAPRREMNGYICMICSCGRTSAHTWPNFPQKVLINFKTWWTRVDAVRPSVYHVCRGHRTHGTEASGRQAPKKTRYLPLWLSPSRSRPKEEVGGGGLTRHTRSQEIWPPAHVRLARNSRNIS